MKRFDLVELGKRLYRVRKKKGLTMEKVAKDTLVSATTIKNYEYANNVPSILNLIALAEYYGVSLEWLCYGESEG